MRNGSYTSSTVSSGSLTLMDRVLRPTGPPSNRLHMTERISREGLSRPSESTPKKARPSRATGPSTTPLRSTWAKSLTCRSRRLPMRGVPRDRRAISAAPSSSRSTSRIPAARVTMDCRSAGS